MQAIDFTFARDIPTADEYTRRVEAPPAVKATWHRFRRTAFRVRLVARLVLRKRELTRVAKRVEAVLIKPAAESDELIRTELMALLGQERGLRETYWTFRNAVRRERDLLSRITLRLADDSLLVIDDAIETLELSVDPEVREYLACELQRIPDSRS